MTTEFLPRPDAYGDVPGGNDHTLMQWAHAVHDEAPVDAEIIDETFIPVERDPDAIEGELVADANINGLREQYAREDRAARREPRGPILRDSEWNNDSASSRRARGYTPLAADEFATVFDAMTRRAQTATTKVAPPETEVASDPISSPDSELVAERQVITDARAVVDAAIAQAEKDGVGAITLRSTYFRDLYKDDSTKVLKLARDVMAVVRTVQQWRNEAQVQGRTLEDGEVRSRYRKLWHKEHLNRNDAYAGDRMMETRIVTQLTNFKGELYF